MSSLPILREKDPSEKKIQEQTPWYSQGLHFKCTECGKCCTGAPGYVWITEEEIKHMADFLGFDSEKFVKKYVRKVSNRLALIEMKKTYDCVFLRDKRCQIYPVRPKQCRTFPWWASNLSSPEAWKEAAEYCEGINPEAPRVSLDVIQANLQGE